MEISELKELVDNYQPNENVLEAVEKISLVGTVGTTASGKTTVMDSAIRSRLSPHLKLVMSDVSRPKRPGEKEGKDYYFREKAQMVDGIKKGIYVQVALIPGGDIYATRPQSYPKDGVGVMAIMGHVISTFRGLPFENMRAAFIVPRSYEDWKKWLAKQAKESNWDKHQLDSRIVEAKQSYEFALSDKWIRFVLNDVPVKAGKRLLQVAAGGTPELEPKARSLAELQLRELKKNNHSLIN